MQTQLIRTPVLIAIFLGLVFAAGCSSTTWEDARQAGTYEAYQAYIEDNPDGKHVAEAQVRADSLYWYSIKNDTSASNVKEYLDKFPGGQFRSEAQQKYDQLSGTSTEGRVTGSSLIIRSDHTTESSSVGVIAKEGTVVKILGKYTAGNSNEAILKHSITAAKNGRQIRLESGKAMRILADKSDSVRASFSTTYGALETMVNKDNIEAMSGETWYKIKTTDNITGWIYGKFLEEL